MSAQTPAIAHAPTSQAVESPEISTEKGDFEHRELTDIDLAKQTNFVLDNTGELSKQHDLSFKATLIQFKKAMAICFGVGLCAMGDGYQYKMPGNIVALPGFIRQMGFQDAAGVWKLDPQHVAAWGGKSSLRYHKIE